MDSRCELAQAPAFINVVGILHHWRVNTIATFNVVLKVLSTLSEPQNVGARSASEQAASSYGINAVPTS